MRNAPDDLHRFLEPFDPAVRELALATRALVLEEAPHAMEIIYDAYNAVADGFTFTGRTSDSFIHIATYARWVNLGFNRGAALDDPKKLLVGNGKTIRHIRIASLEDLKPPSVRAFIRAAIAIAPKGAAPAKSEVRAVYARKRRPAGT